MRRRLVAIATASVISVSIVSLVFAAWTSDGGGSASAHAGTAKPLETIEATAHIGGLLYPDGPAADVVIDIRNNNSYPITVSAVTRTGAISAGGENPGCVTTGVTFSDQAGLSITVSPDASTRAVLRGAASMSNASEDDCQGATFAIPVSLTGASS